MAARIACAAVCASTVLQKFRVAVMISDRLRGWLVSLDSLDAIPIECRRIEAPKRISLGQRFYLSQPDFAG